MGIKRIVDTDFWEDPKVIDKFSVEDKYFLLYLMTNPHSSQVGIYRLPKRIISFETGYTLEVVAVLLQRFEEEYKNIVYSNATQEIAVLNSLKYSVVKGGKPVSDLLKKELSQVDDSKLIQVAYEHLQKFWKKSTRSFDQTIKFIFEEELKKRRLYYKNDKENDNENVNDNENDNEESYPDSYNDSYHDSSEPPPPSDDFNIYSFMQETFGRTFNSIENETLGYWLQDYPVELIKEAVKEAVLNNAYSLKYIETILISWEKQKLTTVAMVREHQQKRKGKNGKQSNVPKIESNSEVEF